MKNKTKKIIQIPEGIKRIGIFGDVHGNDDNLSLMFNTHKDIERWFCLGDAIELWGAKHNNHPTLRKMLFKEVNSIIGNHERDLFNHIQLIKQFNDEQRLLEYLQSFQFCLEIFFGEMRLALFHASHESIDDHIGPRNSDFEYGIKFAEVDSDIIFIGHTHVQYAKKLKSKKIINPGALENGEYVILEKTVLLSY